MMQRHIAVWMQTEDNEEAARILRGVADRLLLVGSEVAGDMLLTTEGEPCGEVKILFVGAAA